MGRISKIMRDKFGLPEQIEKGREAEKDPVSEKKIKDYFDNLFKENESNSISNKTFYELFQKKYLEINKREYNLDYNAASLRDIIYYFTKDPKFLSTPSRSFDKGLMLFGHYGLGKTSIMRAIREIKHPDLSFGMKSTLDVVSAYDESGPNGIVYWNKINKFMFDDLGTEIKGKFYGKETEVMREVLEKRHYNKLITHVSTNLDGEQLRCKYGERVYSRMFEMFNIIKFEGSDYREKI